MAEPVMTPEMRAEALRMLGSGQANQAGRIVDPNARAAAMQAQEQAAVQGQQPQPQVSPQTPLGGPAAQPAGLGGPVQGYQPGNVPRQNGGQMTPAQAKKLAEILRNR
jgi:hypothetical protein